MNIMNWWQTRLQREKLALMACVVVLLCTVFYLAIEPMVEDRQRQEEALPGLRDDLAWMQNRLELIQQYRDPEVANAGVQISPALIEEIIRQLGLQESMSDLKPLVDGGVKIEFEEVDYIKLLSFLYRANQSGSAIVSRTLINMVENKPGYVKASLTFNSEPVSIP